MATVLAESGMKARFESQRAAIVAATPEALARLLKENQLKWGRIVRDKNIAVD